MTSSAKCHKCDRIAYSFCYHDGYWHCDDHGPITDSTANQNIVVDTKSTDGTNLHDSVPGYKAMNRRDRRALERQLRKRK